MRGMAIGLAAAIAVAGGVQAQDIGGTYAVQGTNLDGSPYTGTAEISMTSDTTCTIAWTTGTTSSRGICMHVGPAFAAAYTMGEAAGLVVYEIEGSGVLNGTWTVAGQPGSGTEVLSPR